MFNTLSAFFLFSSLFLVGCATSTKEEAKQKAGYHLQIGTSHLMNKNYPQALRELLNAERLDPENAIVQNNLGLAYVVREKYIEAEKKYLRALEIDPKYTDARNNIGRMFIDLGLYDKAIENLLQATADLTYTNPEKSWSNLGQAYFQKGEFEKSKNAFKKSLSTNKQSCFSLNYYGRALFELKNYKEASSSLELAIENCKNSGFEEPYFYSGVTFFKLGQHDLARARFNELQALYPNSNYMKRVHEMMEIIK